MPDDLNVMRTTVMELESSVAPPDFGELQARARARRGGRRIARAALVLTLIVAVGLVWRWAGPGPLAAQPAIPQVTQSHDPDLSLAAAAARVEPVITKAGTIERTVGNNAGMVLAVYANCGKPTDCERGWRIMTHSGDTKGQDAPIDPGTLIAPVRSGFYVGAPWSVLTVYGVLVPRLAASDERAQPGDVVVALMASVTCCPYRASRACAAAEMDTSDARNSPASESP